MRRGSGVPQCNIVTRMPLATIALLFKQAINNFRTRLPPELPMAPSIGSPVIICSSLQIAASVELYNTGRAHGTKPLFIKLG